jgi:hypothetical protein
MTDIEVTTSDSSEAVAEIQLELNESQASVEFEQFGFTNPLSQCL